MYEENGTPLEAVHEFEEKFMEYFDGTKADINDVLRIAMKAWNYFPHKTLKGKSPNQIVEDYKRNK